MFIGTWALIRPMRNIFSPVSGWNALSYKYLHLHNSSSVIFKSARLSPFLYNNCLVNIRTKLNRGWVITCIWWPRLVHSPAVCQWQTDSKGSSQRGNEAPYPCTCSDPNTVSRCRFYPSTSCQLLRLLVPSPTGSSLTPVPSFPLPHAHTATQPHHAALPGSLPAAVSSARLDSKTWGRFHTGWSSREDAQASRTPATESNRCTTRYRPIASLLDLSIPILLSLSTPLLTPFDAVIDNACTPARPPRRPAYLLRQEMVTLYQFGIWNFLFVRPVSKDITNTVVLYVKCVVNFVISF